MGQQPRTTSTQATEPRRATSAVQTQHEQHSNEGASPYQLEQEASLFVPASYQAPLAPGEDRTERPALARPQDGKRRQHSRIRATEVETMMNQPPSTAAGARSPGYHQKAMEEIQNSLRPFAKSSSSMSSSSGANDASSVVGGSGGGLGSSAASTISSFSAATSSGVSSMLTSSCSNGGLGMGMGSGDNKEMQLRHALGQLLSLGYSEETSIRALQICQGRLDAALEYLLLIKQQQSNLMLVDASSPPLPSNTKCFTKLIRKPSLERELMPGGARASPALDSGAGSSRSDSPRLATASDIYHHHSVSRYSPSAGLMGVMNSSEPPPPPPPRNTPPPPPPPHNVLGSSPYTNCSPASSSSASTASASALTNVQQLLKRMSPAAVPVPTLPARAPPAVPPYGSSSAAVSSASQQRGTSPVSGGGTGGQNGRQPMVVQNGPQVQQQLSQQMQALNMYGVVGGNGGGGGEPPPPYPLTGSAKDISAPPPPPPSYSASIQHRHSPPCSANVHPPDFRKSPSSGIYSGSTSSAAGSPSPVPPPSVVVGPSNGPPIMSRPTPLLGWGGAPSRHQKPKQSTALLSAVAAPPPPPPVIMQSVKSTQVQKPVLQTATMPTVPPATSQQTSGSAVPPPPSYTASIQQKGYTTTTSKPAAPLPQTSAPITNNNGASNNGLNSASPSPSLCAVPSTEPPSYASTMQAKAAKAQRVAMSPPPPPYEENGAGNSTGMDPSSRASPQVIGGHHPHHHHVSTAHAPLQRKYSPVVAMATDLRADSPQSTSSDNGARQMYGMLLENGGAPPLPPTASSSVKPAHLHNGHCHNHTTTAASAAAKPPPCSASPPLLPPYTKIKHQSPIPERKQISKEKEEERRDGKVKHYSPQAFKFFMEQHIENVIKSYKQRMSRRAQLENEMIKVGLTSEAQQQMRKMLSQKESNYIRLKRAKMDKSMFVKIKPIGVGAFGEVTLVRKIDTKHLYAMKTLRKADVLKRNQVAHVKAERDILAEADNEWVVKLYYSFQDSDILYFVMDYIPGGDLMSLLIKLAVFEEPLARFYIAELTCAVESVHKMGFIHRDIKPDNILIDKDGHIKLTDFGLCTGFRWTHNSKYYQPNGDHNRQDSMDPIDGHDYPASGGGIDSSSSSCSECKCKGLKPLERRRRREHRCLAHSLVGTPNYIAPEVLQRQGYTHVCDWWSVGVILYEMLVGHPPFLANTPAETQHKVINWETTLQIPKSAALSPQSTDLILKLCCGASMRLGKDASEVKSHPFFRDINFDKELRKQPAPYIPRIEYPTDTSNFDPIDPEKLRNNSTSLDSNETDELTDSSRPFHGFFEFTFRRFFDDGGGPAFSKNNVDTNDNSQGPVYV